MSTIDLSVRMQPLAKMDLDPRGDALSVRIAPAPRDMRGLPAGTLWVWAVVQEDPRGNSPARILIGGPAESYVEACVRAQEELDKYPKPTPER